jgi:hypothetical protein
MRDASTPRDAIRREIDELAAAELRPLVFGGWAKDFLGLWRGGMHRDLDLLIVTGDIRAVDAFIADRGKPPFPGTRHAHKRAYWSDGLLVELLCVADDPDGPITNCYGHYRHRWLTPLACRVAVTDEQTLEVVTPENIAAYERAHPLVQRAFYTAYPDRDDPDAGVRPDRRFAYPDECLLP